MINKLNDFIAVNPKTKCLEELSELRLKIEEFDAVLPNFEELEVAVSFKDELKKASLTAKRDAMITMLEFTLIDIVVMAKKRVSPVGIFEFYDRIKTDFATK